MVKMILSHSSKNAIEFCQKHNLHIGKDAILILSASSLEGLRFRYEDVIRLPGWSNHSEVEEIEERILRTHVTAGTDWDIDANLPTYTRDFLRLISEGKLEDICTFGTVTH